MSRLLYVFLVLAFFSLQCNNAKPDNVEADDISVADPEDIWFDYQVWGEEGGDSVTVKLQYRYGENGETVLLNKKTICEFDGKPVQPGNSAVTGPYYELRFPIASFGGTHTIRFVHTNGREYKERFSYEPISLATELPPSIKRGTLVFDLQGINKGGFVRLLMTDTVFGSNGIEKFERIRDGKMIVTAEELSELASGPVHLELIRENERQVDEQTREGGRISVWYALKRDFILED